MASARWTRSGRKFSARRTRIGIDRTHCRTGTRGNASTTSSAGCFNVKDYDGFLASVGGRDVTFGLTVVEDRPR